MPDLQRSALLSFVAGFSRRQAARTAEVPGGFAAYDPAFPHSRGNNLVVMDGEFDPLALPRTVDAALGHLSHRMVYVLDETAGEACTEPLLRAGYSRSAYVLMEHTGPVPEAAGSAAVVELDALREALERQWRVFLPDAGDAVIRQLVERRSVRHRGAAEVRFLASRTPQGEVAAWADLYLDPASGIAQIEELVTAQAHLRHGHGDAVLSTALRTAADSGCGTRFLVADAQDWPQEWYRRRGFEAVGNLACFERA
ncbi:GNAT family N-acetyltransferase [Streptomyces sp. NPDC087440]|uniref:GNAT family N-acetyltransferase n=1 Tax=Streptomyces sp. NPDC087440 TaxID=3365790 RepID=UPI00382EFE93